MNKRNTISIDLAKNVFQVRVFDSLDKTILNKRLSRSGLKSFLCEYPVSNIVMEACASSHYWGRLSHEHGHNVHLVPAQHVTPFVRGNKNDKNDCLAIYEASCRPNMRFVPVKSEQQQGILLLHRVRERLIAARTACFNQTRSLLLEFGICIPKGRKAFREYLETRLGEAHHPSVVMLLVEAKEELTLLDEKIQHIETQFQQTNQHSPAATIMQSLPGVGPLIASAYSAAIDKGQAFKKAKELSVWLGLTPLQYASGSINRLSGITKRGDSYLRKQLIHGARTVVNHAHKKDDDLNRWITSLVARRGKNKAVVATAHRLARVMWVLLQKGQPYQAQYTQQGAQ